MNTKKQPKISNPHFRHAVELIDEGQVVQLRALLHERPNLLTDTADEDGTFAGGYFQNPKLLWFVAENPIRNEKLPDNITEITSIIIEVAKQHHIPDLIEQMNYTLVLVSSGRIARECGLQTSLIEVLVTHGADPNKGIRPSLAHKEIEACQKLVDCGAKLTLSIASALGLERDLMRLLENASQDDKQEALSLAAINSQAVCIKHLLVHGTDPNLFNPEGLHAHSTPLHQAAFNGCLECVRTLVEGGSDIHIPDKLYNGNVIGWAKHAGHDNVTDYLKNL